MRRLLLTLALMACVFPATAGAATLNATPSNFASVFASAQAGDTILLASGDYGTFTGAMKSGEVTIKEADGATAKMALSFRPAANITIDGLDITGANIGDSRTKNITVRNSTIPGHVTFRTGELQNSAILFDRNTHPNVDMCAGCGDARVFLPERVEDQPSGITISNSDFYGGISDGILNGSNGTRIIANKFHDFALDPTGDQHIDMIQLYGSKNTLIRGNWFYNLREGQMPMGLHDGAEREVIEDNLVGPNVTYPWAISLGSDDGSIIRHNTFIDGACEFNLRCGTIRLSAKSSCAYANECDPGKGTIVKDNIAGSVSIGDRVTVAENSYNLLREGTATNNNIIGLPTYIGPLTSYEGYRLAADSLGRGNASDGLDRGVRFGDAPAPEPTPDPEPEPTPEPEPEPEPTPDPDYNPVCAPLCDETIAKFTDRLDRIHTIADKNVWDVSKSTLRQRLLDIREIVHE